MAEHGFIVDRTYRIVNGQPKVYLFGRLQNGESFLTISDYRPFFYIQETDLEKATTLVEFFKTEKTTMRTLTNKTVSKVWVAEPRLVPEVRKFLEKEGITSFEADIRFTQRFLMERDILGNLSIEGNHKQGQTVNRIYENPKLTPSTENITLKTLSIDLEASDANDGDLYSVALAGAEVGKEITFRKTFFLKNTQSHNEELLKEAQAVEGTEIINTEKELLEKLSKTIQQYDPDIITGWNVVDFDLAFLKNKYDKHKLEFTWGRVDWPNKLRIESSFARESKAEIPGRCVLDGIQTLRASLINLDDYKLGSVAHEFLGEEKLIGQENKVEEIINSYHKDPAHLIRYNLKDAELVLQIFEHKKLLQLTMLRSSIVGLTMDRVKASIASLDSLYIRELTKRGYVANNAVYQEKEQGITGGYVKASMPGIYEYVIVLDFKSLYPSIMRTFNIDPLHHRPECQLYEDEKEKTLIKSPNNTCFLNDEGILPKLLEHVWKQRDEAKKQQDMTASHAFKILMNSFFGAMASPACRFFNMELANAITHFAQHFIKLTIERLEQEGYTVIYGDTDSVFLDLKVNSYEEAENIGNKIQEITNKFYGEHITKEYNRTSYLELEFEKVYKKFLMPKVRGSDKGAKKRYAGLLMKKTKEGFKEDMEFTGLEFVRRDWTDLAKEFQLTLLNKIFHDEPVIDYVKNFVQEVKEGKHDELLVYKKAIRKDLDSYTKTTPPHVKAARILMQEQGSLDSTLIEYVMTSNGPEPYGHAKGNIDYDHYLEKQVKPLADAVLGFFDTSYDDVLSGSSQQTLMGF